MRNDGGAEQSSLRTAAQGKCSCGQCQFGMSCKCQLCQPCRRVLQWEMCTKCVCNTSFDHINSAN